MKLIQTRNNCVGCTKCGRRCPTNAITFKDGKAVIDDSICVLCGECISACPQGSLYLLSDMIKVENWLDSGRKVVLSISSAYYAAWSDFTGHQVIGALKKCGFMAVHESSEAANAIISQYAQFAKVSAMDTIITSCCPTVNNMIEKYYPDLLPYIAPIDTPITAHAKYLKEKYGKDALVVYAGPCFSIKEEALLRENEGLVDAVLTFKELHRFIGQRGIHITECEEMNPDSMEVGISNLQVTSGGLVTALRKNEDFPDEEFKSVHISGTQNCMFVLDEIRKGYYHNSIVEMVSCNGGCVNGPARPRGSSGLNNNLHLESDFRKEKFCQEQADEFLKAVAIGHVYYDKAPKLPMPSEEEIQETLKSIGRSNLLRELDCGGCGFRTCRENAIAICRGRSSVESCIQYLHEQASSLSNLVMHQTPNYIMVLDNTLKIREFSDSCERAFRMKREEAIGKEIIELMDDRDYITVNSTHVDLRNKVVELPEYNKIVLQHICYIEGEDMLLAILEDITAQKKREQELLREKKEIAEVAQRVIDQQMVTAQTIAGLLGEATAETKVTLNKMIKSMLGEGGGR